MKIVEALAIANNKINQSRRLHSILTSDKFENAYNVVIASIDNRSALEEFGGLVHEGRCDALILWIKEHQVLDITELSVAQLRILASSYGIYKYYRKTKIELIQEVRYALERPRMCKHCGKRHPEIACFDENAEFEI